MSDHPTVAGYCLWIVLVLLLLTALNRCAGITDYDTRDPHHGSHIPSHVHHH